MREIPRSCASSHSEATHLCQGTCAGCCGLVFAYSESQYPSMKRATPQECGDAVSLEEVVAKLELQKENKSDIVMLYILVKTSFTISV